MAIINSLLDNDFYAFTMGQVVWRHHRDDVVEYRFINRQKTPLAEIILASQLQSELDRFAGLKFQEEEIAYLGSLGLFCRDYLEALRQVVLPKLTVEVEAGDIRISAEGRWWQAILLETPVLAIITEMYQVALLRRDGVYREQATKEGMTKLEGKIGLLQLNPDLAVAEFGSRRRYSFAWQRHVIRRLQRTVPEQLLGTSNVLLAKELGLKPIGTMAHQMDMCYAALEVERGTDNPLAAAQQKVRDDWKSIYKDQLNVYLTDTFGTRFALQHMVNGEAVNWTGFRQDSGDPIVYGENLLQWMTERGLDPANHFMLCSDGLNIEKADQIQRHFDGRLAVKFGIGTNLTNDLVHPGLNAVWKPVAINGLPVVKLSDEPGKFTGSPEAIDNYLKESGYSKIETKKFRPSQSTAA